MGTDGTLFDLRYPFSTFFDFYSSGYFKHLPALHLLIGHILVLLLIFWSFLRNKGRFISTCCYLYICLNFAVNPSLKFGALSLSDFFVLIAACCSLLTNSSFLNRKSIVLLGSISLVAAHSVTMFLYYQLGTNEDFLIRLILIGKLFAVAFAVNNLVISVHRSRTNLQIFSEILSLALLISSVVYCVQLTVFKSGTLPFGTMPSAGFGGQRFGGLSMEGGHLSKFVFPMVLGSWLLSKKFWQKIISVFATGVFLLNVSASGYSFFAFYILATGVLYGFIAIKRLSPTDLPKLFALGVTIAVIVIAASKTPTVGALLDKISDSVSSSNDVNRDIYGRSPEILIRSLDKFPLGTGYSGSTQRNLAMELIGLGQTENNLGVNAYFSQLSFLGLLLLIPATIHLGRKATKARKASRTSCLVSASCAAVPITSFFVFAVDILWTLPQLWAIVLLSNYSGWYPLRWQSHKSP